VFVPPAGSFREAAAAALVDTGLIAALTLLVCAGAVVAFLRYDVR